MAYRFGDVLVHPNRRELRRAGHLVPAEPKVLDVLLYLIGHRDRVVSKDELLDQFWSQEEVYDGAVSVCIHRCRRAVGDSPEDPVIRTFSGRGYRFVASVEELHDERPAVLAAQAEALLVGRQRELKRLQDAMQAVLKGSKRVVMIAGDPGIGKTCLLTEASHRARQLGFDVLWGTAGDDNRHVPFALWRDLLATYAAWHEPDDLRARLGADAALVGRIAPAVIERLRLPRSLTASPEAEDRARLFAAVATLLTPKPDAPPLALFIDAMHYIGLASLRLIQELAGPSFSGPLLIVGAYRTLDVGHQSGAPDVRGDLRDRWVSETLHLGPLSRGEISELIVRRAGKAVTRNLLEAVVNCAEGVPAVAVEHWHTLVRSGVAVASASGWISRGEPSAIVPAADRSSLLAARIANLSATAQRTLSAAAVIGREFRLTTLASVLKATADETAAALEEAAAARIVQKSRWRGRWRFSHELVRDFVYAQLDTHARADLHQRVGKALESQIDANDRQSLPVAAQHFLDGATPETAAHAVSVAYQAGLHAFGMLAFEKAVSFFEQALAVLEAFSPPDTVDAWDLRFALAESCIRTGNIGRARAALEAISQQSRRTTAPTSTSESPAEPIETVRFLSLLRTGMLPAVDNQETARQAAEQRRQSLEKATAAARAGRDLTGILSVLLARRWNLSTGPVARERLRLSTEAQLIAEQVGNLRLQREATLLHIHDLLENGQRSEADRDIDRFLSLCRKDPDPVGNWIAAYLRAGVALLEGRFADAQNLAHQAMLAGGTGLADLSTPTFGTQINGVLTLQGRSDELALLLEGFVLQFPSLHIGHATLARAYSESDRLEDCRRELEIARQLDPSEDPLAGSLWQSGAAALARVCNRLDDRSTAAVVYERLLPYRDTCIVIPAAVACQGSAASHLAVLAATAGHWQQALDLFEEGFAVNRRIGALPVVAHAQYELARLLLRRESRTERQWAGDLLKQAEETARELDMPGLLQWIAALSRSA